jgi:hypothetical protein
MAGKISTGVLVFCLFLGATAWAQDEYPRGRIIGSVEIPALFDESSKKSSNARASVTLHSRPSDGAPPVVVVKDRTVFETLEHGYEELSVGVLEISWHNNERWYLVQYKDGDRTNEGWLSPHDAGTFRFLLNILQGRMAFLTSAWDRVLYRTPKIDAPKERLPKLSDKPDVVVATGAGDPQQLWLLVVILDGTICNGGSRAVLAAGWIPGHSATGQVTTWHYSRGC